MCVLELATVWSRVMWLPRGQSAESVLGGCIDKDTNWLTWLG